MLKTTVVIATYNGEKYVIEQLESIRLQTQKADEVLIFDDCSTDDTVSIIKKFFKKYGLNNWTIIENNENKGWRKNFIDGFSYANGDIVFCADQDDVWNLDKIEKMVSVFEQNPNVEVLACNLVPKYENDATPLDDFYVRPYGKKLLENISSENYIFDVIRPGCAMCFRSDITQLIIKIWRYPIAHDTMLWMIGILKGTAFILNIPLMEFRRHENNNSPNNKKTSENRKKLIYNDILKAKIILENQNLIQVDKKKNENIKNIMNFNKKRYEAISNRNIIKIFFLGLRFKDYKNPKIWIADVISVLNA